MTYAQASQSACVALLCTVSLARVGNVHPCAGNSRTYGITVYNDAFPTAMFILHRMSWECWMNRISILQVTVVCCKGLPWYAPEETTFFWPVSTSVTFVWDVKQCGLVQRKVYQSTRPHVSEDSNAGAYWPEYLKSLTKETLFRAAGNPLQIESGT